MCEPTPIVHQSSMVVALLSGAAAGLCTDVALFPLDTVKTRLQSAQGFVAAGGLRGIYCGLGSVVTGSMPGSALFFCTYEGIKTLVGDRTTSQLIGVHMSAAACGEVMACLVRVPCEVIKQRAQVAVNLSSLAILRTTIAQEGIPGLYRGYTTTVLREVPFSLIQFPLWEFFKSRWEVLQGHEVMPWQSALCGCLAGGLSGFITTPLDVAKTRIMLAKGGSVLATRGLLHALYEDFSAAEYFQVNRRTARLHRQHVLRYNSVIDTNSLKVKSLASSSRRSTDHSWTASKLTWRLSAAWVLNKTRPSR